jgi:hypothetical protein
MAGGVRIEVHDAELLLAFKRAEEEVKLGLKAELLAAGKLVEERAHELIRTQRLVGGPRSTGRLDRLTRASVRSAGTVVVRSGATRQGFSYPRFQEFGRGRAFLYPALAGSKAAIAARVDRMLDRVAAAFN